MYLARQRINNKIHFFIRQSIAGPGYMQSRDLYDLGADPARYIIYPGGNSFYIDPCIEEYLIGQGIEANQFDLEAIFFEFLKPETQRVISGFDRRTSSRLERIVEGDLSQLHFFDKRRYHYLRFGRRLPACINQIPKKVFLPLLKKSRDELEQYFMSAERILGPAEGFNYLWIIFELRHFMPDPHSDMALPEQLDAFFVKSLCRLNSDKDFKAGLPSGNGLHEYLRRYAVMYFDGQRPLTRWEHDYIDEFIGRHRTYRPPRTVQIKIEEAEKLFGCPWKELRRMDRSALTRIYRKSALKHHPDQGGRSETFQRLTAYYRVLLARK